MTEIKERLDTFLVKNGYFETRERAQKNINAGNVFVANKRILKCSEKISLDAKIDIVGEVIPYVSRGGLKLEKAIGEFGIKLDGLIAMDVGASTGGFTDCMLKNNAVKVFAVDVGVNQLVSQLRNDTRVISLEKTNIRNVKSSDIGEQLDFLTIDVSFISLKLVLPVVKELLGVNGEVIALIKPQFEAGKNRVGKNGVVRDYKVHRAVLNEVISYALDVGYEFKGLTYSPVKGPEGNIEYLVYLKNTHLKGLWDKKIDLLIEGIVESSHGALD
jgi:23S rRNA (cytidine1920-2'-O)/16S rRNA (cytidine1409-2'-O)-methyltransferase